MTVHVMTEPPVATTKYPKSVGFIIGNEFCERFNYYGMRTILVLYLTSKLHYDADTSTVLFHVFTMLVYLCPLLGALVADSWLGKFKTILYLSVVYAIGGVIVAIGAVPNIEVPAKEATIIGLILIAVGTGGIKPCVSAFGGDQFSLPEQAKELATFFSMFYFAINAGSLISTSITPILRQDVHCFGEKDCFSLAFGVPAVLMLLSVVIFVAGKKLYVMKAPAGNMIFGVSCCISEALSMWRKDRKLNPRKHWLDHAEAKCGARMVSDTKRLLKILVLYLPFPVFWALFDQQGSRWTFQAARMDGEMLGYVVKPDQMQVVNPFLILGFIPLFDYVIYPILAKVGIKRPLQKLTIGGMLAATAFVLSAFVEYKLEAAEPMKPTEFGGHLRIYNGMPCPYTFETDLQLSAAHKTSKLEPLEMWEERDLVVQQEMAYGFKATSADQKCPSISGVFNMQPGKAMSYFIAHDQVHEFEESTELPQLGVPMVRMLLNTPPAPGGFYLLSADSEKTELTTYSAQQVVSASIGENKVVAGNDAIATINARAGGVYTLLLNGNPANGFVSRLFEIRQPNSVHMLWQLPQIFVITAAEIMFSVTGLEFSFTQAPQSMKSVLQACWLLTVAIGNMLVVVIAELKVFPSQAAEFLLFAAIMFADIFIFMLLAMRYKYVEQNEADPEVGGHDRVEKVAGKEVPQRSGQSNEAYIDSEH